MLHDPITRDLKEGVSDAEESDCESIAAGRHASPLEHIIVGFAVEHFGVTDIAYEVGFGSAETMQRREGAITSVQEVQQVHPAAQRDDAQVEPAIQALVGGFVVHFFHIRVHAHGTFVLLYCTLIMFIPLGSGILNMRYAKGFVDFPFRGRHVALEFYLQVVDRYVVLFFHLL